jgi:hypothetical protein
MELSIKRYLSYPNKKLMKIKEINKNRESLIEEIKKRNINGFHIK